MARRQTRKERATAQINRPAPVRAAAIPRNLAPAAGQPGRALEACRPGPAAQVPLELGRAAQVRTAGVALARPTVVVEQAALAQALVERAQAALAQPTVERGRAVRGQRTVVVERA